MDTKVLRDNSDHVAHEIEMMYWTYNKLESITNKIRSMAPPADNEILREQLCYLEAHLVHLRNLRDFLFHKKREKKKCRKEDDTLYADYFKNENSGPWQKPSMTDKDKFKDIFDTLHKMMFHITLKRPDLFKEGINYKHDTDFLREKIKSALLLFYEWVPKEHIDERLKKLIDSEMKVNPS